MDRKIILKAIIFVTALIAAAVVLIGNIKRKNNDENDF